MLEVIILAAGKGTRMRSNTPKVLHTLAGKSFLQHVIDRTADLGADKIHVVVGHGAQMVKQSLQGQDINYVQQTEQLGTGHAVKQVLDHLDPSSKTLILYGDVPLTKASTLQKLIDHPTATSMGLLTVNLANPKGYGRIVRDGMRVKAIVEQKDASAQQLEINEVNTGVMAVSTQHLLKWLPKLKNDNAQGEYYLTDIIAMSDAEGIEIKTAQPDEEHEVLGVNNRIQQAELERIHQKALANELMVNGVTLLDPSRIDIRGCLSAGKDCVIDVNCVFQGDVVLGDGVYIGANCVITQATIGDHTHIKEFSHIEDARLKQHCIVGPYARLRPKTELSDNVKIGNFVEIKKAHIGEGSKVNHLSYIGDAQLGKGVNVGAGSITCNYDGVNKHQTIINDGVFIGSNSVMIAPVEIGGHSFTAAGSTISSSVPSGQLAVARAKQRNIEGWVRPKKDDK